MSVLGAKSKCANTGDYLLQAKHHPGHFPSTLLFLSTSTLRELIAVNVASCARRRNEQQKKKKKKKKNRKYETDRKITHADTKKRVWSMNTVP